MTHPSTELNEVVHQRARLGILTVLNEVPKADFAALKRTLELTDGNLSRHLAVLEDAGYVKIDKTYEGRKPKTWVAVTAAGRRELKREVDALRRLLGLNGSG